ncbi:MAG: chloride channel protein [Verrucomicrobia bacterium]|nr:chloride channel protein [Verrucomicrobiota bacterium]
MRLFSVVKNYIPLDARLYLQPIAYGLVGGLAAVAFQEAIQLCTRFYWQPLRKVPLPTFAVSSFVVMLVASFLSALILKYVSPDAAGSGIPQIKVAFWQNFGFVRLRAAIAKFFAGALTIGGGVSLGREGPSVHIAGALASNTAGLFGASKNQRRPALLAGAAAGLTAAFNTPLSAMTFVLEEIIEDLNSTRYLAQVLIAAVTSTFVTHIFLGDNPAFIIPKIGPLSWPTYLLVIPVAAAGSLAGVIFQNGTLNWRQRLQNWHPVPGLFKPSIGALINWGLGVFGFALTARLGVFGLGYSDLEDFLHGAAAWKDTAILLVLKLAATITAYSWGNAGGIFSPTLFFGAGIGFVVSHLLATSLPLNDSDHVALTVAGMSACLGAVVRAPITSILIVFEMTHQFTFVPLLMIGTLVSQGISRAFCKDNFYSEILKRDGFDLDRHMPVRSWASLQRQSIGSLATFSPVIVSTQERSELRASIEAHPYKFFPLVQDGVLQGLVARDEITNDGPTPVRILPAQTAPPETTVLEATKLMVDSSAPILVLVPPGQRKPIALVTLHDVLRAQARLAEQF